MNKIILIGRTTKDIELRYTTSSVAVASFSLAVSRTFKNKDGEYETDFINCVAYKGIAETLSNYVKKGDKLGVEGRLQIRTYTDSDVKTIYVSEVIIENIEFLEPKKTELSNSQVIKKAMDDEEIEVPVSDDPTALTDDDLPF